MKQWLKDVAQFAACMMLLIMLLAAYGSYAKMSVAVIIRQADE